MKNNTHDDYLCDNFVTRMQDNTIDIKRVIKWDKPQNLTKNHRPEKWSRFYHMETENTFPAY